MPKKIEIQITESVEFLKKLYNKHTTKLIKDRIKTLIYVKEGKYCYQLEIANKLGRTDKAVRKWLKMYQEDGLNLIIEVESGGNNTRIITDQMRTFIEEKVKNPHTTITSYVELQAILFEKFGVEIPYEALRIHCIRNYGTKLKVARKSHHKKDPNAEAFFKKP